MNVVNVMNVVKCLVRDSGTLTTFIALTTFYNTSGASETIRI